MSETANNNTSRREFIKKTTAAAAGVSLTSQLAINTKAYAASDNTIKIGLIGCGGRGTGAASDALDGDPNCKIVAMADVFSDHIDAKSAIIKKYLEKQPERYAVDEDHKFVGLDAYQKLIDSDVDLVILATPPAFRPLHFEAAVKAGKNVFMEKPLATDPAGVRRVLAAAKVAKEKNLKVGVGLQRHHQAPYLETIKRIKDGAIGDIRALHVYWVGGGVWDPRKTRDQVKSELEYQLRNWYYYDWICGDHIVEQHIHNLDVANWVMDAFPVEARGMGGRQFRTDKKYGNIYDHHAVEFKYADGTICFSQCRHTPNAWSSVSEHAIGSTGTANISGAKIESGGTKWRYKEKSRSPYKQEHIDLFNAIRNDEQYSEAVNGAMSTLTAIMGRLATYSGQVIKWDDAMKSDKVLVPDDIAWDKAPPILPDENGVYAAAVPGVTKVL